MVILSDRLISVSPRGLEIHAIILDCKEFCSCKTVDESLV